MKAVLEFDLDNQEDKDRYIQCVKAQDMAIVLFEFARNSRKKVENSYVEGEEWHTAIFKVYEEFYELLEEHNINIDEICM